MASSDTLERVRRPGTTYSTSRWPYAYPFVLLGILMVVAAVLRFHAIGQKPIWIDEGVSIELARLDWYNFLRILWRHEANMTLYYLLLRAWLPFGSSEAYIRALSVLPSLAAIPAVYALGRRMFDSRVGLIASFLLTINAYDVRYSQEARSYSLYPFLCILSSIYFLRCLPDPSPRNRVGHVLTSALGVYAHFFAGFVVVAQWLSLRRLDRGDVQQQMKKNWRQFAVAVSPLALFIITTGTGVVRWIPRPGLSSLKDCALFLTGNGGVLLALGFLAAAFVALLPVFRTALVRRVSWESWRYHFLLLWLLFPILFIFLVSQLKPFFLVRYFVFTLPALVLLAASGLARVRSRWLLACALIFFAVFSLRGVSSFYQQDFDISREDWRLAARYLLSHAEAGDVVLFHQPIARMPYEYYRSVIPAAANPTVVYPEHGDRLTYRDFYAGHAPDKFLESVCGRYPRIWVALAYNETPSRPDPTTRSITSIFGPEYASMQQANFPGIQLRLYTGPKASGHQP
jgi:mannosyltransferase